MGSAFNLLHGQSEWGMMLHHGSDAYAYVNECGILLLDFAGWDIPDGGEREGGQLGTH